MDVDLWILFRSAFDDPAGLSEVGRISGESLFRQSKMIHVKSISGSIGGVCNKHEKRGRSSVAEEAGLSEDWYSYLM